MPRKRGQPGVPHQTAAPSITLPRQQGYWQQEWGLWSTVSQILFSLPLLSFFAYFVYFFFLLWLSVYAISKHTCFVLEFVLSQGLILSSAFTKSWALPLHSNCLQVLLLQWTWSSESDSSSWAWQGKKHRQLLLQVHRDSNYPASTGGHKRKLSPKLSHLPSC